MHTKEFLHKLLSPVMHKKRLMTLILLVGVSLNIKKLSLTELGRGIELPIQERSGIRRADRFLGNEKLSREREAVYRVIIERVIGNNGTPEVLVDWSNIPNTTHNVLRAALVGRGRAITLYEEVHPEKKLGNRKVQHKFLSRLKKLLPENCKAILLTDGGFHNEWFREVERLGWDYIGRIRAGSGKKFKYKGEETWINIGYCSRKATSTPRYVGHVDLGKEHPIATHLYLFKGQVKKRKALTKEGKKQRNSHSLDYGRSGREPWLLATSLKGRSFLSAKRVIKKYKKRMQIEEGFRDLKSSQYGLGFEKALTKKIARIEILLMIAMLACFIAWLVGWIIERNELHYQFQANTIRNRRVLSLFFLGCRAIRRGMLVTIPMLETAITGGIDYA